MNVCKECVHHVVDVGRLATTPAGRVDYTLQICNQGTPIPCYDNRRVEGACGPEGKFFVKAPQ